jgi:hypothetical protein
MTAAYHIRTKKAPRYTHLEISGEIRAGMAKLVAQEVIDAYAKDPGRRLLVDVRGLTVLVSPAETVEMVSAYPDLLKEVRPAMTAVVYREGDYDTIRFYETVARNRGYQTEIFTDLAQAQSWLAS